MGMFQRGEASYYAEKFHGKRTANGERFDMYAMTAAHKTLPFGTVVSVTNLRNSRKIQVRINDRGPYIDGRIIDLSKRAAQELKMARTGVAPVELVIVSLPKERKLTTKNRTKALGKPIGQMPKQSRDTRELLDQRRFAIQVASYSQLEYAQQYRERLKMTAFRYILRSMANITGSSLST